jgi:hypothetical protein
MIKKEEYIQVARYKMLSYLQLNYHLALVLFNGDRMSYYKQNAGLASRVCSELDLPVVLDLFSTGEKSKPFPKQ